MRVGIIGAGMAGLSCAKKFKEQNIECSVFEKARGVSGRMSTRYADDYEFDHGAQFITVSYEAFQKFMDEMERLEIVQQWSPRTGEYDDAGTYLETALTKKLYVPKPRMNSLAAYLKEGLDIHIATRIDQIHAQGDRWVLRDEAGNEHGPFDWLISSAPAPQSLVLFDGIYNGLEVIGETSMQGAFTVMLGFKSPLESNFDMVRPHNSCLSNITLNSSKPDRHQHVQCWVLQSNHAWSEVHMEDDKSEVMKIMMNEAKDLTGLPFDQADHKDIHRWRYAISSAPLGKPFMMDQKKKLALCGDWCASNKVEGAYISATELAETIISL